MVNLVIINLKVYKSNLLIFKAVGQNQNMLMSVSGAGIGGQVQINMGSQQQHQHQQQQQQQQQRMMIRGMNQQGGNLRQVCKTHTKESKPMKYLTFLLGLQILQQQPPQYQQQMRPNQIQQQRTLQQQLGMHQMQIGPQQAQQQQQQQQTDPLLRDLLT